MTTRFHLVYGKAMDSAQIDFFIEYMLRPDEEYDQNGEDSEAVRWFWEVNGI